MTKEVSGSCLCGAIKFKIEGDFEHFFLCHCKHCQKDTGSAHAANIFSSNTRVEWIAGEKEVKTYNLPSTRHSKSFCQHCGSAVPTVGESMTVIPAGCLDTDSPILPDSHIFVSSKANWENGLESITKFDTYPTA